MHHWLRGNGCLWTPQQKPGASISLSQWCILHIPAISIKVLNFPYFPSIYDFLLSPILTMMHLCIILYTYWMPLTETFKASIIKVHTLYFTVGDSIQRTVHLSRNYRASVILHYTVCLCMPSMCYITQPSMWTYLKLLSQFRIGVEYKSILVVLHQFT